MITESVDDQGEFEKWLHHSSQRELWKDWHAGGNWEVESEGLGRKGNTKEETEAQIHIWIINRKIGYKWTHFVFRGLRFFAPKAHFRRVVLYDKLFHNFPVPMISCADFSFLEALEITKFEPRRDIWLFWAHTALEETLNCKNLKTVWQNSNVFCFNSRSHEPPQPICREWYWQNRTILRRFKLDWRAPVLSGRLRRPLRCTAGSR